MPNDKAAIDAYKKDRGAEWGAFEIIDASGEVYEASGKRIGIVTEREELESE
jgi:hypothetical protein